VNKERKPIVWSIAGSDNSGGAGIQADNLTLHDFNVHACNIITAITAQNSQRLMSMNCVSEHDFIAQYESLKSEYSPDVIKLGMLGSAAIVTTLAQILANVRVPIVCDPVLRSSSGGHLIDDANAYQLLLPYISVFTPNQQEFSVLINSSIDSIEALEQAAIAFAVKYKLSLVVTGGDNQYATTESADLCVVNGEAFWLKSPHVEQKNTHGTGCTFASSIAALLAKGYFVLDAIVLSKAYINQCLITKIEFDHVVKGPIQHAGFPLSIACLPLLNRHKATQLIFPRENSHCLGVYPVVDSVDWLERCLAEGIKTIQLRVKNKAPVEISGMIKIACEMGRQYQARLYINDYWQLAIEHGAYGVHLGQEDLDVADLQAIANAGLHLGVSTHSWYEIARAHSIKPSYIAIGPIYETTTKVMPFAPQGLEQLKQWVEFIGDTYPVVAIGGIDSTNAEQVLQTGVGSIAMVRAITEAVDYKAAIRSLQTKMEFAVASH